MNIRPRPHRAHTVYALAAAVLAALGAVVVSVVLSLGVDGSLRVAGALALVACAAVATAIAALALTLRRRLSELRHLPDLGRRFETHYAGVHLTGIAPTAGGAMALLVTESSRTIVLDESGAPDQVRSEGPGELQCPLSEIDGRRLRQAIQSGEVVSLTTTGVITLAGPVHTGWRIRTAPGPVAHGH